MAYQDNTPIQDTNGVVIIKHGFSHNQDEYNRTEYPVPRNGILELNFYPPVDENVYTLGIEVIYCLLYLLYSLLRNNCWFHFIKAQYQDLVEWFSTINRAQSASNSFIQCVLRTDNAKVNEEVAIEVNSTMPLDTYVYEVMGRGNLVLARTVQAGNQRYWLLNYATEHVGEMCSFYCVNFTGRTRSASRLLRPWLQWRVSLFITFELMVK